LKNSGTSSGDLAKLSVLRGHRCPLPRSLPHDWSRIRGRQLWPTQFELHDLHGNVSEWVDCFINNYRDAPRDGSAVTNCAYPNRVLRSGNYTSIPEGVRSASRAVGRPNESDNTTGMRAARTSYSVFRAAHERLSIQSLWEWASDDRKEIIPCEVKQRRQCDVKHAFVPTSCGLLLPHTYHEVARSIL
jgi:hypothetical protein